MVTVAGQAEAHHLGIDRGSSFQGKIKRFEDHHPAAFTDHKPVAIPIKRPGGFLGFIVAGRERFHGVETGNSGRRNHCLGSAGNHGIDATILNHLKRVANRMGAGGTGRGKRQIRPFSAKVDGNHSRCHIPDHHGNKKRAHPPGTFGGNIEDRVFHNAKAAKTAAGNHTDAI